MSRTNHRFTSLILATLWVAMLASAPARGAVDVVEGRESAVYEIVDPQGLLVTPDTSAGGFSQRVLWWKGDRRWISVDVRLSRYPHAGHVQGPSQRRDALDAELQELMGTGASRPDAIRRIVAWVGREFRYRWPDGRPESLARLLRERSGSCQGRTELVLMAARRLGIEARAVHGLLIGDDRARFHRWPSFETERGDWFMADPGLSLDFVDARHLVARVKEEGLTAPVRRAADLGIQVRQVSRHQDVVVTDRVPSLESIRSRRLGREQHSGALLVQLIGRQEWDGWGIALEGASGSIAAVIGDAGRAGVAGLGQGLYRLTVVRTDRSGRLRVQLRREVRLGVRELHRRTLRVEEEETE